MAESWGGLGGLVTEPSRKEGGAVLRAIGGKERRESSKRDGCGGIRGFGEPKS